MSFFNTKTSINTKGKTIAALASGAAIIGGPAAGLSSAAPIRMEVPETSTAAANQAAQAATSINTTDDTQKKNTLSETKQAKNADNTYTRFADTMKNSPLSSSNTEGVFDTFSAFSEATLQQWQENGVPAAANIISENYNVGVPAYTPQYLPVVEQNGNYIQVNVNDEEETQLRENIIKTAESKAGLPYIWGGNNPNVGLDCSGFTKWVYGQNGIVTPRVVADIRPVIKPISEADAKPGDLVFVNGTEHIGIVLDATKHTYWEEPHPGSYAQIGNYSYGHNISFGTVINNTEHPVGVSADAILNRVNNGNATSTVQVGDKGNSTLTEELKKAATKPATPSKPITKTTESKPTSTPTPSNSKTPTDTPTPTSSATTTATPTATATSIPQVTTKPKPTSSSLTTTATPSTPAKTSNSTNSSTPSSNTTTTTSSNTTTTTSKATTPTSNSNTTSKTTLSTVKNTSTTTSSLPTATSTVESTAVPTVESTSTPTAASTAVPTIK